MVIEKFRVVHWKAIKMMFLEWSVEKCKKYAKIVSGNTYG